MDSGERKVGSSAEDTLGNSAEGTLHGDEPAAVVAVPSALGGIVSP